MSQFQVSVYSKNVLILLFINYKHRVFSIRSPLSFPLAFLTQQYLTHQPSLLIVFLNLKNIFSMLLLRLQINYNIDMIRAVFTRFLQGFINNSFYKVLYTCLQTNLPSASVLTTMHWVIRNKKIIKILFVFQEFYLQQH